MQKRKLAKSNLEVLALGFGCMGMSWSYGPPKDSNIWEQLILEQVDGVSLRTCASMRVDL